MVKKFENGGAQTVYRDGSTGSPHEPVKSDIRELLTQYETFLNDLFDLSDSSVEDIKSLNAAIADYGLSLADLTGLSRTLEYSLFRLSVKQSWDASSGSFPSGSSLSEMYLVSADGTVDGVTFKAGQIIMSLINDASTSVYSGNWHKVLSGQDLLDARDQSVGSADAVGVTPEFYGAVGDGITDDTAAIQSAFSSEKIVRFRPGSTYRITSAVTVTDKNVDIVGDSGAELLLDSDTAQIKFKYTYTDVQNVSSVDQTATVLMNDGTGATQTPCTEITVSDSSQYSSGDVVKIVSDDLLSGVDPSDNIRAGEHAVVFNVSGSVITLDRRLRTNGGVLSTNVRVARASKKRCNLGFLNIDGNRDNNTTRGAVSYLNVVGCSYLNIQDIKTRRTQGPAVFVLSCHQPEIVHGLFRNGKTVASTGAFAHGLLFGACSDIKVGSVKGIDMRHLVDTSGFSTSTSDDVEKYGNVSGGTINEVVGTGMQAPPASTHADADDLIFISVRSVNPIHGPHGYYGATGFRGRNNRVEFSETNDGNALSVFTDYDDPDNCRGNSAGKLRVVSNGRHNQSRAVRIIGSSGAVIPTVHVDSVEFISSEDDNISPVVLVQYGSVMISKMLTIGGSDSNSVIVLDCDESGTIEVMEWIGRDMTVFRGVDIKDDSGSVTIHKLDIDTGSTQWGRIANLNSADCKFHLYSARFSTRGDTSDLILDRGSSADTQADWLIVDSSYQNSDRTRSRLPTITASSAANYDIDIEDRCSPRMIQTIVTSVAGASIRQISDGLVFGQTLTLHNKWGGAGGDHAIKLIDNGSGARVPDAKIIDVGDSITLFWDGYDWRPETQTSSINIESITLTLSTATSHSISLSDTQAEVVYVELLPAVSGASVNYIDEGAYKGQRIVLSVKYDGSTYTDDVVLEHNSSGNVATGASDLTIVSGRGVSLIWDGDGDWRIT